MPKNMTRRRSIGLMMTGLCTVAALPGRASAQSTPAHAVKQSARYFGRNYCDILEPSNGAKKTPIIMVHGGSHTGAGYLTTPDGRPGWAPYFAAHGYKVIVPDWVGTGRSGYVPDDKLNGETVVAGLREIIEAQGVPVTLLVHSMSGPYGWKLAEEIPDRIARVVAIAPGAPGNIQPPVQIVNQTADYIDVQQATVIRLSTKEPFVAPPEFVKAKYIGKSAQFPQEAVAQYAASLRPIPPLLVRERVNVADSQLKIADEGAFKNKRMVLIVGTNDIDHPPETDRKIADWFNERGARMDFIALGDKGITGNGHMMMLEKNSDQIAQLVEQWIATH